MRPVLAVLACLCSGPTWGQTPLVYCRIGGWGQTTGAAVCEALRRDTVPLKVHHGAAYGAIVCQRDLTRDLDLGGPTGDEGLALSTAAMICSDVLAANPEWARR